MVQAYTDKEEDELVLLRNICRDCNNYSADGYVLCLSCMYGTATRASKELIALKKKWTKRRAKELKDGNKN